MLLLAAIVASEIESEIVPPAAACAARGDALPAALRAGVISLGIFVDRHTSDVNAGRATIEALVDINLSVIDGLAGESLAA